MAKEVSGIELKISADAEPTQGDLEDIRMKKGGEKSFVAARQDNSQVVVFKVNPLPTMVKVTDFNNHIHGEVHVRQGRRGPVEEDRIRLPSPEC